MRRLLMPVLVLSLLLIRARAGRADRPESSLFAAISVNQPVFEAGDTDRLQVEFTLVNDGSRTIDPKIGSSQILVNGKALPDSEFILTNGPRDGRFDALPPHDYLLFGYALGDHFKQPGIYHVSWRGEKFRAAEIVFRVLPKRRARASGAALPPVAEHAGPAEAAPGAAPPNPSSAELLALLERARRLATGRLKGLHPDALVQGWAAPGYSSRESACATGTLVSFKVRGTERAERLGEMEDRVVVIFPNDPGEEITVRRVSVWQRQGLLGVTR